MAALVNDVLRDAAAKLVAAGVDNPALDARLLLAHALGVDQAALLRRQGPVPVEAFEALLHRRLAREPVAFILGRQGFWTLDVAVSPETLIPRGDSETVVEAVLAARPERARVSRVLDLGTGSGCLLLAVLSEYPQAWGLGVDLAAGAARLAAANSRGLGLADRAVFAVADWAAPVAGGFDVVLSNPPYIPSGDIQGLMPEVALFEPRRALDGGADGLDAYRALLAMLPRVLAPGGVAVFEMGSGQDGALTRLAIRHGFAATTRADLAGVARVLVLEKRVGNGGGAH